jgi:hypothetical protein
LSLLVAAVGLPSLPVLLLQAKRSLPNYNNDTNIVHATSERKEMTPISKVMSNHLDIPSSEWIEHHYPHLSGDFCNQTSPPEIPPIQLDNEQFRVYHIGKAAGGTVETRIEDGYQIKFNRCHPNPTPCFEEDVNITTDRQYRFITIRDPIDRYVAAFEWTLAIACVPGQTTFCRKMRPYLKRIYDKYNEDPSLLGEALCDPDDGYKLNATIVEEDFVDLKHLKADNVIYRWLGEHRKEQYDWRSLGKYLYPLVVEKPFDIIRMVDEAAYHMARVTSNYYQTEEKDISTQMNVDSYFGDLNLLPLRQYHASCKLAEEDSHKHSSSNTRGRPELSERAQLCLARYYQRDYELLPDLKRLACKTNDCRAALQSIIDRRAPLLSKLPPRTTE